MYESSRHAKPPRKPAALSSATVPVPKHRVLKNGIGIVLLGSGIGSWLYRFTDWWEVFGTVLAFGGILALLPFVAKLLTEDERTAVVGWFGDWLFRSRYTWAVAISVLILLIIVSASLATVPLDNVQGFGDAAYRVYGRADPGPENTDRLTVGARQRSLWWVCPWSRRTIHVKVSGLPLKTLTVRSWFGSGKSSVQVVVAASFLRPIVIVAATPALAKDSLTNEYQLEVFVNGNSVYCREYKGEVLLLGAAACDTDLPLPSALQKSDGWESALHAFPDQFANPTLIATDSPLNPGDQVYTIVRFANPRENESSVARTPPEALHRPADGGDVIHPILLRAIS